MLERLTIDGLSLRAIVDLMGLGYLARSCGVEKAVAEDRGGRLM